MSEPTMEDAIAAGTGTLHGAIDYWQEKCSQLAALNVELIDALKIARWRMANLVGPEGAKGLDREALMKVEAAIAKAKAVQS